MGLNVGLFQGEGGGLGTPFLIFFYWGVPWAPFYEILEAALNFFVCFAFVCVKDTTTPCLLFMFAVIPHLLRQEQHYR